MPKKNPMTLEDVARLVAGGFEDMQQRMATKAEVREGIQGAKIELGAEIQDLRSAMSAGFTDVGEAISKLKDLLLPTGRALDTTLLDVRELKQRVSKLEKQAR